MKLILAFFFLHGICYGSGWDSNRSSRTITAETTVRVSSSSPGDILSSVQITSCTNTAGQYFRIYDSSAQVSGLIAQINISTAIALNAAAIDCRREYNFSIRLSSALTYTTTAGADVTILWSKEQYYYTP